MTLAEQADAATTRDALAAAARLMVLCGDLSDLQPDRTPAPTPSVTRPQEADSDWYAWLAEHPYDAELWAQAGGDEFRQEVEGTTFYQIHVVGRRWGDAGVSLREWFDRTRNRALVRTLRATGDHDLADRIDQED